MYAILESGGKQYKVQEGSKITVEKLAAEPGSQMELDKVLLLGGDKCEVGAPYLSGVTVKAEILSQVRGPKVLVFKRRRRKDSKCLHGHRQDGTVLRIVSIVKSASQD